MYIDYIFHYDDQPILFTLKDDFSNLYLCVCYELCEYQKWFIANIDFNDLKEMNDNKKSVLESFLKNQSLLQGPAGLQRFFCGLWSTDCLYRPDYRLCFAETRRYAYR